VHHLGDAHYREHVVEFKAFGAAAGLVFLERFEAEEGEVEEVLNKLAVGELFFLGVHRFITLLPHDCKEHGLNGRFHDELSCLCLHILESQSLAGRIQSLLVHLLVDIRHRRVEVAQQRAADVFFAVGAEVLDTPQQEGEEHTPILLGACLVFPGSFKLVVRGFDREGHS